jgi:SprT protein
VSETQNQNSHTNVIGTASRNPDDKGLKELAARARSRTLALLGQIPKASIEVRFDLRGKTAGQVRIRARGQFLIRYNPDLLKRGGADFLDRTVPHEVAHVLAYHRHGPNIRPHGPEWQRIMRQLGAEPTRCHDFDVSGLSARRLQYFDYHCGCMEHQLSSIRHNKVGKGQRYLCRRCGEPLQHGRRVKGSAQKA